MKNTSKNKLLPFFNVDGTLPPGDYSFTFKQLKESYLVSPSDKYPTFDTNWRLTLVNNLEILVKQLWTVRITDIYIDGSFVEEKDHPNDIDGYFIVDIKYFVSGEFQKDLNLIDRYKIWNWKDRLLDNKTKKRQLMMWHKYNVELFPHFGQSSGITDEFGNELDFPAAFRKTRSNKQKGIIKLLMDNTLTKESY